VQGQYAGDERRNLKEDNDGRRGQDCLSNKGNAETSFDPIEEYDDADAAFFL
jgi:hypothetical protein